MAESGERSWWRRTRLLAVAVLAAGGSVSLVFMLAAPALDAVREGGFPLGLFGATLAAPAFVILVAFWAAGRQRRIDRAHGFYED